MVMATSSSDPGDSPWFVRRERSTSAAAGRSSARLRRQACTMGRRSSGSTDRSGSSFMTR
ncbi:hypothetical protein BKM31_43415 [[Actinomadura] parvosata subsp. kistnae]|uniref:Uncharacterized protein n=1 Tax=[Actinomadura] parvosata subsp. kistnae TaxID=1909395 RepID=A0A1V0AB31_9ACTN|nr:hypothetical protein BKM31_43415 [Nonomuraea sp. ATCC 55076]